MVTRNLACRFILRRLESSSQIPQDIPPLLNAEKMSSILLCASTCIRAKTRVRRGKRFPPHSKYLRPIAKIAFPGSFISSVLSVISAAAKEDSEIHTQEYLTRREGGASSEHAVIALTSTRIENAMSLRSLTIFMRQYQMRSVLRSYKVAPRTIPTRLECHSWSSQETECVEWSRLNLQAERTWIALSNWLIFGVLVLVTTFCREVVSLRMHVPML